MRNLEGARLAMGALVHMLDLDDRHKLVASDCADAVRARKRVEPGTTPLDLLALSLVVAARRGAELRVSGNLGLVVAAYFGWEIGSKPGPDEELRVLGSVLGAVKAALPFEPAPSGPVDLDHLGRRRLPPEEVLGLLGPFEDTEGVALSWRMVRR